MKNQILASLVVCSSSAALGASVTAVNPKKKTVDVSLGEDESYEKGSSICFFSAAGKKIDCGRVARIKGTTATVSMKKSKKFGRIKPGLEGRSPDAAPAAEGSEGAAMAAAGAPSKKPKFRIWGYYSAALATAFKYNKLEYLAPEGTAPETLWKSDGTAASSMQTFNLQVGIPISSFSLNVGLRSQSLPATIVESDYVPPPARDPYAVTEISAKALGFWFVAELFQSALTQSMAFNVGTGIDVDMSTVTLKSTKKDDTAGTESTIASATSKVTVLSLRIPVGIDYLFTSSFGAYAGTNIMLPLAEFGKAVSGGIEEAELRGAADDTKTALGHGKNSIAYDIAVGAVLAC